MANVCMLCDSEEVKFPLFQEVNIISTVIPVKVVKYILVSSWCDVCREVLET